MVVDENNFLPDNQELHERIDREEDCIVNSLLVRKSKLYMKMVGLLVKSIIITSYLKNTTSRLTILMVLRFSYFKLRNFWGTKFRDFARFWQSCESLEPRNTWLHSIREIRFLRKFLILQLWKFFLGKKCFFLRRLLIITRHNILNE